MPWDDKTRFRITTWPTGPVPFPAPQALAGEVFLSSMTPQYGDDWEDPDAKRLGYAKEEDSYPIEVPGVYDEMEFGEVYLELYALDLTDPAAIFEFVEKYSSLCFRSPTFGHDGYNHYLGFEGLPTWWATTGALLKAWGSDDPEIEREGEFMVGAWCLRDMTTAWRVLQGDVELGDAEWLTPCWANATLPIQRKGDRRPSPWRVSDWQPEAVPELVLQLGLAAGLRPFFPRLQFFDAADKPVDPDEAIFYDQVGVGDAGHTRAGVYGGEIPLYCVCCLELFNHMAEAAEYRTCANETCVRLFVRQSGRALHGQHRTQGVKYCSSACARSQAQRQYRRRLRRK